MHDHELARSLVLERQAQLIAEARSEVQVAASSSPVAAAIARLLRRMADRLQPVPQAEASLSSLVVENDLAHLGQTWTRQVLKNRRRHDYRAAD